MCILKFILIEKVSKAWSEFNYLKGTSILIINLQLL
jgi:hypothetical protein